MEYSDFLAKFVWCFPPFLANVVWCFPPLCTAHYVDIHLKSKIEIYPVDFPNRSKQSVHDTGKKRTKGILIFLPCSFVMFKTFEYIPKENISKDG